MSLFKRAAVRNDCGRDILAFFIDQVGELVKVAASGKEEVSGVKRILEVGRATNCDLAMEVLINGIDSNDLATVKYIIQQGSFHI